MQALKEAQAVHARSEQVGAGVALVGIIGFVALVAAKSLGRDPANDAVTESAALLDAVQSEYALGTV